jgi:NADH dehydrogenase
VSGHPRRIVELGDGLAYLQARMMEMMPVPPLTRDNLDSTRVDSVLTGPLAPELGVEPLAMEAVVPFYLAGKMPRDHFNKLRDRAGR